MNNKYKFTKIFLYSILTIFFVALWLHMLFFSNVADVISTFENKTFDLRQKFLSKYKKQPQEILIIAIDDFSYESLTQKYGQWPIPRYIYTKITNYLQQFNPKTIVFDLMFVQSLKDSHSNNINFSNIFRKYNNTFTAFNFDNQQTNLRTPINLQDNLKASVINSSNINFDKSYLLNFSNFRSILQPILNSTANLGHINLIRDEDGLIRRVPPFIKYQNDFYPHLALNVSKNYLNIHNNLYDIDKYNTLKFSNRKIPLDKNGLAVLNWHKSIYDNNHINSFSSISFNNLLLDIDKQQKLYSKQIFENKIILIGTSASSLFDIKSTPVDKYLPGVCVLATFIDNIIHNDFISVLNNSQQIFITISVCILCALTWILAPNSLISAIELLFQLISYILLTLFFMHFFNLWLPIISPFISLVLLFICIYIIKYMIKSKDLEQAYKLATTDMMTGLFNHRYFQEKMIEQLNLSQRYKNNKFSLIMIDIDYFKKFNDTYGHQTGDQVLRHVANLLKANVRECDIVCRYGGEEMTIILPSTDLPQALVTAQKLCNVIRNSKFNFNSCKNCSITISLGVSSFPLSGLTPEQLIAFADKQLYFAKQNGRNQVGNRLL